MAAMMLFLHAVVLDILYVDFASCLCYICSHCLCALAKWHFHRQYGCSLCVCLYLLACFLINGKGRGHMPLTAQRFHLL